MPRSDVLLNTVNAYLLKGEKGYWLVDAGWNIPEAHAFLVQQLEELGLSTDDIRAVLVTHSHPDHYGLAARLREESQTRIYLHYLDRAVLTERYLDPGPYLEKIKNWLSCNGVPSTLVRVMYRISSAMMKNPNPAPPDVDLRGDEILDNGTFALKVLWAPGHSPGQVCYYDNNNQIIFSGDHILPHTVPHIGLWPQSTGDPIGDYLSSLERVSQLDIKMALPGHENPFNSVRQRIEGIVRHHKRKENDILNQMAKAPATAFEIASGIPWSIDLGGVPFSDLSIFDQRLAVGETLAHLEHLRVLGQVSRQETDNLNYFQLN